MHHYRQIIVRLRLGDGIRNIANAGLASRKKIRVIRKMSIQQGWLNIEHELPSDEILSKYFKRLSASPVTQSSVLIYQEQIEAWCKQGIQASSIYTTLQRNAQRPEHDEKRDR